MTYLVSDLLADRAFIEVQDLCSARVFLKIEALNPAGSIKIKAARGMIFALERAGRIATDTRLIESSSGNLGVALAMVCAEKSIPFTCVIDPNTAESNRKTIEALGAEVVVVCKKDENGGYLGSRISYIKDRVSREPDMIWLNQYANPANPREHARTTARSISEEFAQIDYLFVGAGTTGTLMGCRDFFIEHRPETKIVAVDSVGSITFGFPAGKRHIPGLGTSRKPEIFESYGLHALEMVEEQKAIQMCRWLARKHGLLAGGSTGTVLAGIYEWRDRLKPDDVIVSISPDLGDRYLDTIYNDAWVTQRFGTDALSSCLISNNSKKFEVA